MGVFARHAERHQILRDRLNAVDFSLGDDSMRIVGRNESVEQLVHYFDLHTRRFEHLRAVYFLQRLEPLAVLLVDGLVLFELLVDDFIRLLNCLAQGDLRSGQLFVADCLDILFACT